MPSGIRPEEYYWRANRARKRRDRRSALRSIASFSAGVILARSWPANFLRDLALDGEQIVQIAIVLLHPDVSVSAGVDQLRIHVKPCRRLYGRCPPAHAIHADHCRSDADFVCRDIPSRCVRLITFRSAIFASLVRMSSCTPSTKARASSLARLNFQTAERRFRLLAVAGLIRFPKRSSPAALPVQSGTLPEARWLDCAAPIFFRARKFQCGALDWFVL